MLNTLAERSALRAADRAADASTAPRRTPRPSCSPPFAKACGRSWMRPQVKIDAYRRNLQNAYLEMVNTKLNGSTEPPRGRGGGRWRSRRTCAPARSDDEKPFYRAELHALNASIDAAHRQSHGSRYQGASGRRAGIRSRRFSIRNFCLRPRPLPPPAVAASRAFSSTRSDRYR